MKPEIVQLLLAFATGVILGAFFYGGLWLTVKKGLASAKPALWFGISMLVRTSMVLLVFYVVGAGNWQRFLACLAGFIIIRFVLTMLIRLSGKQEQISPVEAVHHAP